jgi:hypothetical protein
MNYGNPTWTTRGELLSVLSQYRQWMASGNDDRAMTLLIRDVLNRPNNPGLREWSRKPVEVRFVVER